MNIGSSVFALSMVFSLHSALGHASEARFSDRLKTKVMAYHRQHPDFEPFRYKRPSTSSKWQFEKADFTQYLVNLHYMVVSVYDAIDSSALDSADKAELKSLIAGTQLGKSIVSDLEYEHDGYHFIKPSPEAVIYREHVLNASWQRDPVFMLMSVYTVVFGHAFGAQSFLERARELDVAMSTRSSAYPSKALLELMQIGLSALIDRLADSNLENLYFKYLTLEFVIQGSSLRILDKSMFPLNLSLFRQQRVELLSQLSFPPWHRGILAGSHPFWWMNLVDSLKDALW